MIYFNDIIYIQFYFFQEAEKKVLNNINNSNQINNNSGQIDLKNIKNSNESKDKKTQELEANVSILNKQLSEAKKKISDLSKENSELKQIIDELNLSKNNQQKENSELKQKIKELNLKINNQTNPNNPNIHIKINELYEKIEDLQEKLKRFPFILEKNEKLMSIIFSSVDQKIHYSIVCKNTDNINKLEGELYREYPQFSETDNYFMCKGKLLNKFHTFESNNIKNGDVIIVNQRDD